jgi:V8-like Glu-specific endopeptidase
MRRRAPLLAYALFAAAGCGPLPVGEESQGIVGGEVDTADPAAVLLVAHAGQRTALCTGAVVSPHVVLTAAHCVDPSQVGAGATFQVFLGDDYHDPSQAGDASLYVAVAETHYSSKFDPSNLAGANDVGVAITKSALPVTPLPMNRIAPSTGDTLRIIGFGATVGMDFSGTTTGTRRQATITVAEMDDRFLYVEDRDHMICQGDSGGPALLVRDGVEYVAGIASYGDNDCTVAAAETRVDVYATVFADPYVAEFDPGSAAPGGAFGAYCTRNADCLSGQCALSGSSGYCSNSCSGSAPTTCPSSGHCDTSSDQPLCAMGAPTSKSSGCSVGGSRGGPGVLGTVFALLTVLTAARRRRSGRYSHF